ncbi:MAG: response regulator [Anaerolineae bacterium]|nr:response regulator [Anaerolineae bacterium]
MGSQDNNVLIVDDDLTIQDLLRDCLASLDIQLTFSARGKQALELIASGAFQVVVLDLMLPEMSGIEILRRLEGRLPGTEIIVLTGYASVRNAVEALRFGAYDYIVKPFHVNDIRAVVKRALEKQRLEARLNAIHAFSREMTLALSVAQIGEAVLDIIGRMLDAEESRLWLLNDTRTALYPLVTRGTPLDAAFKLPLNAAGNVAVAAVAQSERFYIPDLAADAAYTPITPATRSELAVPLTVKSVVIGALNVASSAADAFGPNDVALLSTLAAQVAVTLENARLFEQAQREIAERVAAEQALAKKAAELERSNDELRQFAYIISHDLQEPLRVVGSYTQLLAQRYEGQLDEEADEFIAYVVDGAKRMQAMIKGLLAYTQVGIKGKDLEPVDAQAILERALSGLQVAIQESQVKIESARLPTVMADDLQLSQVFQNLVSNAIRFQPPPADDAHAPPHVHISASRQGSEWLFAVHDNGIGFDPKHSERIFEIFQRLHTQTEYPGTGIGLAVCKKIIERHNGRIWAESEPGNGATFYFTLPAVSE